MMPGYGLTLAAGGVRRPGGLLEVRALSDAELDLYVHEGSVRASRAIAQVRELCETCFHDCELRIIDVAHPRDGSAGQVPIATPTLVKRWPAPERRIVGDLSDRERVLTALSLRPTKQSSPRQRLDDMNEAVLMHPHIRP